MLKFGFKFFQDKKKEEKQNEREIIPELPAFEWQVTEDTGLESCLNTSTISPTITTTSSSLSTLVPPEDAIFGIIDRTDRRRKTTSLIRGHTRSSTNIESSRIRLMQIIDDENSRKRFRDYLVSKYCEENLDFYMDILKFHSHFKNETLKNYEMIISFTNYIWNEYLDPETSSKPLNVPQELLNQCKQKISENLFTNDLFDKLQQHCFDLMLQDSLPKFTRNSMAIPYSTDLNSSSSFNYLCPPNKQLTPRKSLSSGSLRSKMNHAISTLKNAVEPSSQNSLNSLNSSNSPSISPLPSPLPSSIPPQSSSQSSASSPTSTFSTTSSVSTSSTLSSTPTTPTTSIRTPSVTNISTSA
ncbi:RGS domain-containing protein, partial [Glomus cerebriforme]